MSVWAVWLCVCDSTLCEGVGGREYGRRLSQNQGVGISVGVGRLQAKAWVCEFVLGDCT